MSGKRIVIMGLGVLGGGLGSAAFFAKHGAHVLVTDLRSKDELAASIRTLSPYAISYVLGKHRFEDFTAADMIIQNPGVSASSVYLKTARDHGIPIEMAESFFMKISPSQNIIGVTGTRGKSTTCAMIYSVLKKSGLDVVLGGNTSGVSTLSLLDGITPKTWVVLELSSWQLAGFGLSKISPHIAVITNIYQDHLNRYASMEAYMHDKSHIFLYQKPSDTCIYNSDNNLCSNMVEQAPSHCVPYAISDWPTEAVLSIPGEHNIANAAVCLRVCRIVGIDDAVTIAAVRKFRGLPGRLENIATINGISFINDTTSTTPIAGIYALRAVKKGTAILIAGGNSKKLDMDIFIDEIVRSAKAVVCIAGDATQELRDALRARAPHMSISDIYDSLDTAVPEAYKLSTKGDTILLSPGFTSFGMFKNEFDRGNAYVAAVKKIQKTS